MKLLYAIFVLGLLLAACTPQEQNDDGSPYVGGTDGLVMNFLPGSPPAVIFDAGQTPFGVNVMVTNLGESDVGFDSENSDNSFVALSLIGINPNQFGNPDMVKTFQSEDITLRGAKKNINGQIIKGEQDVMEFDNFQYTVDESGQSTVMMRANLCYDYTTRTNTKICIKDNVIELVDDDTICTLSGPKDPKNSGAPVHVTALNEEPIGKNKIQITFTIENVNDGIIFRRVSDGGYGLPEDACDPNPSNIRDRNIVHVTVYTGDDTMTSLIECPLLRGGSNEGDVTLFQGEGQQVFCTLETSESENRVYTDTLHVDLEYTYLDYVETPITIKDVGVTSN